MEDLSCCSGLWFVLKGNLSTYPVSSSTASWHSSFETFWWFDAFGSSFVDKIFACLYHTSICSFFCLIEYRFLQVYLGFLSWRNYGIHSIWAKNLFIPAKIILRKLLAVTIPKHRVWLRFSIIGHPVIISLFQKLMVRYHKNENLE